MKVGIVEVRREEWLRLIAKAEKNIGKEDKTAWQSLRDGADRAKGHAVLYVQKEHHDLITKAANAQVQGPSKP